MDRQEAIDWLDGYIKGKYRDISIPVAKLAIEALKDRPKGEWILSDVQGEDEIRNGNFYYECSNCGHMDLHAKGREAPYCWYCGADMRGDTE